MRLLIYYIYKKGLYNLPPSWNLIVQETRSLLGGVKPIHNFIMKVYCPKKTKNPYCSNIRELSMIIRKWKIDKIGKTNSLTHAMRGSGLLLLPPQVSGQHSPYSLEDYPSVVCTGQRK
jgi:hypothetical protein